MSDFTKLENIFRIFSSSEELAAEKLDKSSSNDSNSLTRQLLKILLDAGAGTSSVEDVQKQLKNLRTTQGNDSSKIKQFNRLISFYSTIGDELGLYETGKSEGSYWSDGKQPTKFSSICGLSFEKVQKAARSGKHVSVCLSRSAYITPHLRSTNKAEMFLNFIPSTVISQCAPYLEMEFEFDRPAEPEARLASPGLLKFLLGAESMNTAGTSADDVMYRALHREGTEQDPNDDTKQVRRTLTSAGMELFTSPQTLINMNQVPAGNRYAPVLDPTRPLASLESFSINVKGTTGVMSFKTAQATIKLHDRSRLAELADIIQPGAEARTTVWVTYGWRHPVSSESSRTAETYGDFINNNMLMKEAYGIQNSSFTFDPSGQVTITLELYTKGVLELRSATTTDDNQLKEIRNQIKKLSKKILDAAGVFNLSPKEGSKEILGYTLIDSAAAGTFPDVKPGAIKKALNNLESTLKKNLKGKQEIQKDIKSLINDLNQYYAQGKKDFSFKEKIALRADAIKKEKLTELSVGADPFLITQEKSDQMMKDFGYDGISHPFLGQINSFKKGLTAGGSKGTYKDVLNRTQAIQNKNDAETIQKLRLLNDGKKDGGDNNVRITASGASVAPRQVVSFGKLFCVFVVPALLNIESVSDYQIFFYNTNEFSGRASATNLAEFPIDLEMFLRQYREVVETTASTLMTVEQFIKLAVDAQITDYRSIAYGFSSIPGVTKAWNEKNPEEIFTEEGAAQLPVLSLQLNSGRGDFKMPQVEVFVEVRNKVKPDDSPDLLNIYNSSFPSGVPRKNKDQVLLVHVFDKSLNPYREEAKILKSNDSLSYAYTSVPDPWVQLMTSRGDAPPALSDSPTDAEPKIYAEDKTLYTRLEGTEGDRPKIIREFVAKRVPTLVPGMNASGIIDVSISTRNDPMLKASQMLGMNIGRNLQASPRGAGIGNMPMRVIPTTMSIRALGCPLVDFAQMFFVDMNTGTTIDNIYGVIGITHSFGQGKFETQLELTLYDAYAKYESATIDNELDKLNTSVDLLRRNEPV